MQYAPFLEGSSSIRRARAAALLLAALMCWGCGESELQRSEEAEEEEVDAGSLPDTSDKGPDPGLQGFSFDTSQAMCEKMFECCSDEQIKNDLGINAESVEQCTEQSSTFGFIFGYSQVDDSVKEGRIRIDESMVELWVESIKNTACSDMESAGALQDTAPGCREVLKPLVNLGGECQIDQDCKTGFCSQQSDESTPTCKDLPQEHEECPDLQCADGFYCNSFDFVCEPALDNGAACFNDQDCKSGSCQTSGDGEQTCAEPEAICGS